MSQRAITPQTCEDIAGIPDQALAPPPWGASICFSSKINSNIFFIKMQALNRGLNKQ